ncbi:uncharacterized protein LOC135490771 isoform X2 [Lineus longissimus]|uniref:uncharacterized protein LOC135490771 isoform X2 n=1 Tax=Lineus longissimus TaxID=88925 RepID=UPI00315CA0EA
MPEVGLPKTPTPSTTLTIDTGDGGKTTVSVTPAEFVEIEKTLSKPDTEEKNEDEEDGEKITIVEDKIFDEIRDKIHQNLEKRSSTMSLMSSAESVDRETLRTAENFQMINHGFQPRASYEQHKKLTDIMGVTYSSRQRQFVILDAKGITIWKKDAVGAQVVRAMNYPKYEYRIITYLVYAKKYNVYFGLGKDFSLKVLNRDFDEVCSVSANLRSVLFMVFNPVKDELITGGVGGTKVWRYYQVAEQSWSEIKPMANYKLGLKYELKNVGGSWVKRVDLDLNLQHLYCCSEMDLYAYDLEGNLLFKFMGAHNLSITGCCYSMAAKLLVTSSMDSEVKVWGIPGGHVHTFRGHSRAVTNLVLHPDTSALFLTSSLDGSVRMWSLDTMDCIYSIVVSSEGVVWMGITDDKFLYVSTVRTIILWSLNFIAQFWALTRNTVSAISLVGAEDKTTRVLTLGEDSSVRLFARSSHKNLSTVLPPPPISPLQRVLSFAYSRKLNIVYILINPHEVWLYTVRTDPACRIAVWDIHQLQEDYRIRSRSPSPTEGGPHIPKTKKFHVAASHSTHNYRATEGGLGNEGVADCSSLAVLDSPVIMWTEEGFCSPLQDHFLLLGMEDGRILFMDPVLKGQKHLEFKACKDRIQRLTISKTYNCLTVLSQLKECAFIQMWSLPGLKLEYEVYCQSDVISFARLDTCLLTGHTSGVVNSHVLYPAEDPGPLRPKATIPAVDPIPTDTLKTDHRTPVIALDSCPKMGVFCSCSSDGAIKVWIEGKVLLTEIMLDDEVSAAIFFNDRADLLIGYKNHLFLIDGSKVVPCMKLGELEDEFDKESDIYEDPAVAFEGVQEDPDPVDLDNYLVPYNMEFSDDFLIGKKPLVEVEEEESEEEEEGSELSWAPTEIYFSPDDMPSERSLLDLTLTTDVSKYDLQQQMKVTEKLEGRRRRRLRQQVCSLADIAQEMKEKETVAHAIRTTLPTFGISPGPTPSVSPASTPTAAMSEDELSLKSDEEETPVEGEVEVKEGKTVQVKEEEKKKPEKKDKVEEKPKETATSEEPAQRKQSVARSRFDAVDIRALMADARKQVPKKEPPKKAPDHSHVRQPETPAERQTGLAAAQIVPRKPVKKKEASKNRKLPKRGSKLTPARKPDAPSPVSAVASSLAATGTLTAEQKKGLQAGEPVKIMRPKVPASAEQPTDSDDEDEVWSSDDEEILRVTGEPGEADREPRKTSGVRRRSAKSKTKQPDVVFDGPMYDGASVKGSEIGVTVEEAGMMKTADEGGAAEATSEGGLKVMTEMQANILPKSKSPAGAVQLGIEPMLEMGHGADAMYRAAKMAWVQRHYGSKSGETLKVLKNYSRMEDDETSPEYGHVTRVSTSDRGRKSKSADSRHRASSALTMETDFTIDEQDEGDFDDGESLFWEMNVSTRQRQRPVTGLTRYRPLSGHDMIPRKPRPFTALVTNKEKDIYRVMEELFTKYKQAGISLDKLYKNDGTNFEDNWQERMIERHMLMKMQKEYRAQSAAHRRHLLEMRQKQKRKQLLGHRECDGESGYFTRSEASLSLGHVERANSVPVGYGRHHLPSTPVPPPPSRPQTQQEIRVRSAFAAQKDQQKAELNSEMPFRLKMQRQSSEEANLRLQKKSSTHIDPRLFDPRNPFNVLRPVSSKSIPSKCSHYVLVSHPKTGSSKVVPSPLEEQLIQDRFPQFKKKWLGNEGQKNRHFPAHGWT